jgi:hypothetical protein
MAPFIMIVLSIGLLALIGFAGAGWGIDSRPSYGDDHAR